MHSAMSASEQERRDEVGVSEASRLDTDDEMYTNMKEGEFGVTKDCWRGRSAEQTTTESARNVQRPYYDHK